MFLITFSKKILTTLIYPVAVKAKQE